MNHNPTELIATVSKSYGKKLDPNDLEDEFIIQQGCYILNCWGVEPAYDYP